MEFRLSQLRGRLIMSVRVLKQRRLAVVVSQESQPQRLFVFWFIFIQLGFGLAE